MNEISLDKINKELYTIELKNNKTAYLFRSRMVIVPEIDSKNETQIYEYKIPCPLCNTENYGYSYDGKLFSIIKINCSFCGIYFRPVVK